MKKIILAFLAQSLFFTSAFAQIAPSPPPPPSADIEGDVQIFNRTLDYPKTGTRDTVEMSFRADGYINITKDGCLKLKARAETGDYYGSDWANTGLAEGEKNINVRLKHLYIDATCLDENTRIELGALPAKAHGYLGLSTHGWIDGLRVTIQEPTQNREWLFSVGQVGNFKETNLFKRDFNQINFAQIDVKQQLNPHLIAYADATLHRGVLSNRVGLTVLLQKYISWVKYTGIEALFADQRLVGHAVVTNFDLGKFNNTIYYVQLTKDPAKDPKALYLYKAYYGLGHNIYWDSTRALSDSLTLRLRLRLGDAGTLTELGLIKKFGVHR